MIFRDALRSLKKDIGRAFFYWLTFVLTTIFIFLFLNIAMSEAVGVTFVHTANTDISTNVSLILIVICIVEIIFANDFYVRSKARDLAVRLVCGATYLQLAEYLLIQTFILLAIAIPVGIISSLALIPIINTVLHTVIQTAFTVTIVPKAVIITAGILIGVIFWATFLNLGFAYRNTAAGMLNESSIKYDSSSILPMGNSNQRLSQIIAVLMLVIPIFLFFWNPDASIISAFIGIAGISGCLTKVINPALTNYVDNRKPDHPFILTGVGFIRTDIQILKWNILLLLITVIFLVSVLITATEAQETILVLLSYIVMNILLSLAIMFRYSTELQSRFKYFRSLEQIGFMHEDQEKIIRIEVAGLYGIVLLTILIYIGSLMLSLIMAGRIAPQNAAILILFFIIPFVLCGIFSQHYYRKAVLIHSRGEGQASTR
ncbi:MAG: hypothetical protein IJI75_15010 [Solobacterium sp.]|nr:hypothetical protein [Solobacterium sp.]